MSSITTVMGRVSNLVNFSKETIINNLLDYKSKGELTIEDSEMRKIASIIDMSVSQSISLGAGDVESALVSLEKQASKVSKRASSKKK